ncbi:MAG: lipid-A-disaccharide synthase N-terminal domain-containing protein, partial [Myxococcales bacterium]
MRLRIINAASASYFYVQFAGARHTETHARSKADVPSRARLFLVKDWAHIIMGLVCLLALISAPVVSAEEPHAIELKLGVPEVEAIYLEPLSDTGAGGFRYRVESADGVRSLTPEAFTRFVYDQHQNRPFWKTLLNITNPIGIAWVGLGLLGQLLFAGRMLVQWLTSEKEQRSVVPAVFWWMSLVGASMLLVYFIWRKD